MRHHDLGGPAARVWRLDPTHARRHPDHAASIGAWLVNGPFHPLWSWWMVYVVHLRDVPGQSQPPNLHYPEAAYEFGIVSIDPDVGEPDVDAIERGDDWAVVKDGVRHKFLSPQDAIVQFDGVDDAGALEVGEAAIRAIVSGAASPDSDYRSYWERTIPATAEHFRPGQPHGAP